VRLALDTNIVMDVFLEREPHHEVAEQLFAAVERGWCEGLICATSVTTIYCLTEKLRSSREAHNQVRRLLSLFRIAPVNALVLSEAIKLEFQDFEDAVVCQSAHTAGADGIVTRDPKGFRRSSIPVFDPANALAMVHQQD
jgi:predicted nucleic acid-binding protein